VAREMMDPTDAIDELVELEVRPKAQMLRQLVGGITGLPPHDERVAMTTLSIISQCVFYRQNGHAIRRLFPGLDLDDPRTVDRIADHVTRFTLAGLGHNDRGTRGKRAMPRRARAKGAKR
jgi:TetR/AcrR family transcriptional regulator, regulator of cefoperazone and chloramphenicol sensitivity